jgi:GPI mannosyltransferase 2
LVTAFFGWKALLLAVALGSAIGPSYDTSTELSFSHRQPYGYSSHHQQFRDHDASTAAATALSTSSLLATRLTRWDAIYFVQIARRGYFFEQEYAFGAGLPFVIRLPLGWLRLFGWEASAALEAAIVGIIVAHTAHLLAVLTLYFLSLRVWNSPRLALIASLLHILSPAGLFLSAPYAESSFAMCSFAGYLCFAEARRYPRQHLQLNLIAAGVWFGLATTFRSNGILNGVLFAAELFSEVLPDALKKFDLRLSLARCAFVVLGGVCTAAGLVMPQVMAWMRYCSGGSGEEPAPRPWCANRLPSIYAFVQSHYW